MSTVASIDIGTITTRLLIVGSGGFRVSDRSFTKLGEGLGASGVLGRPALDRVASTLQNYGDIMRSHGVERFRVTATSAARDAANSDVLAEIVATTLGSDLEVIDGVEEGTLAFLGATAGHLAVGDEAVVIDIGGGSTEFSVGQVGGTNLTVFSADIGASRVAATYLHGDPPKAEELSAALSVVELHIDDAVRELASLQRIASMGTVVGIGGTITSVAAVDLGLMEYDSDRVNGYRLTRAAVEDTFRALATESSAERMHNPGLEHDRVETIVGGLCVLVETMRQLDIDEVLVSEHDLLDGVTSTLLQADSP